MTPEQLAKAREYVESDRHITREMAQQWLEEIERLTLFAKRAEPVLMTATHPSGCPWLKGQLCGCGIDEALAILNVARGQS